MPVQQISLGNLFALKASNNYLLLNGNVLHANSKRVTGRHDICTFRDVVRLCLKSENLLKQHPYAADGALVLKRMVEQKTHYLKRHLRITQIVLHLLDCLSNLLKGWGFIATIELAQQLQGRLEAVSRGSCLPTTHAYSMSPKKRSTLTRFKVHQCQESEIKFIVRDLKNAKHEVGQDPLTSVEGLINFCCETKKVDLSHLEAQKTILDILCHSSSKTVEWVVRDWLLKRRDVPIELIRQALQVFISLQEVNFAALEALIKYNIQEQKAARPYVSVNDPSFLGVLRVEINDRPTLAIDEFMKWVVAQEDFTLDSWIFLTSIYVERILLKQAEYDAYHSLIGFYERKEWKGALIERSTTDPRAQIIVDYFNAPKAQPQERVSWTPKKRVSNPTPSMSTSPSKPVIWPKPNGKIGDVLDRIKTGTIEEKDFTLLRMEFNLKKKQFDLIGMMQYISDSPCMSKINLDHPPLQNFILRVFSIPNENPMTDLLADWLRGQPINADLIKRALAQLSPSSYAGQILSKLIR